MDEPNISLELNAALRSAPLAVSWLNSCLIPTEHGQYRPEDVCLCFMSTCSDLNEGFYSIDLGRPLITTNSLSETFVQKLEELTVNKTREIDAALLYAETAVELDNNGSALTDLIHRFDTTVEARIGLGRVMTALGGMIAIICAHMAAIFGTEWMDNVLYPKPTV